MVEDKLRHAGIKVGEVLGDPYACTPQPCGDLPQLGRLTAVTTAAWTASGTLEKTFEFSDFRGDLRDLRVAYNLSEGRPWYYVQVSLEWNINEALDKYTAQVVVSLAPSAAGVKLVATLSSPPEDVCRAA